MYCEPISISPGESWCGVFKCPAVHAKRALPRRLALEPDLARPAHAEAGFSISIEPASRCKSVGSE